MLGLSPLVNGHSNPQHGKNDYNIVHRRRLFIIDEEDDGQDETKHDHEVRFMDILHEHFTSISYGITKRFGSKANFAWDE